MLKRQREHTNQEARNSVIKVEGRDSCNNCVIIQYFSHITFFIEVANYLTLDSFLSQQLKCDFKCFMKWEIIIFWSIFGLVIVSDKSLYLNIYLKWRDVWNLTGFIWNICMQSTDLWIFITVRKYLTERFEDKTIHSGQDKALNVCQQCNESSYFRKA
jgi:hypothetical protein